MSRDRQQHSKYLCAIIYPLRTALHFHFHIPFLLWPIQKWIKRLLNLIGRKIQPFCFCFCGGKLMTLGGLLSSSMAPRKSVKLTLRWGALTMTFPLTTGHNMFMDPPFGLISPSATQFLTAAWACGGRLFIDCPYRGSIGCKLC